MSAPPSPDPEHVAVPEGVAGAHEGMAPTLSVVVPIHDAAAHLPSLLETLAAEASAEVELVLVDDASTDATPRLLAEFAASAVTPVQVLTQERNGGAGLARRVGLGAARGRWLTWLDVDDRPLPGALARILAAVADAEPSTVLVFGYRYRWPDGRLVDAPGMVDDVVEGSVPAVQALLRHDISAYMWNKVIPREGLNADHFATRRNGQDWLTLAAFFTVHPRVRRIPEVVVDYFQQSDTLSRRTDLLAYTHPDDGLAAQMRELLVRYGLWDECRHAFLHWYAPWISANSAVAAARRDAPGPDDRLGAVARNVRQVLPARVLVSALRRGNRRSAAALLLLRVSPRLFRRVVR